MSYSVIFAWCIAAIILIAVVASRISQRIRTRNKWNTERRSEERRAEERRSAERRKMARTGDNGSASEDRRDTDRRDASRRSDSDWKQDYKNLRNELDKAGFEQDSDIIG